MSRTVEDFEEAGKAPDEWDEAREWADRNGYLVSEDYPAEGTLSVKIGEYEYVLFDRHGGVSKMKLRGVGSGDTELHFGDKQLTVRDDYGDEYHISEQKFSL